MFYLVDLDDSIGLYMADELPPQGITPNREGQAVLMVYRRDPGGVSLEPDSVFRRLLSPAPGGERCIDCLDAMLEMMKPYRGIPADKTRLYVEEMLFRYNCRDRVVAMRCLDPAAAPQGGETVA